MEKNNTHFIGYQVLRTVMGLNLLAHGIVRFPDLPGFSSWMVSTMQNAPVPGSVVAVFGYVLPIVEGVSGVLLLIGIFPRVALIAWGAMVAILTFGTCMIQNWDTANALMIYAIATYILLVKSENAVPLTVLFGKVKKTDSM